MTIGFLKKRTTEIDGAEKSFLAGTILLPLLSRMEITLSKNKDDQKPENAPEYFIYMTRPKNYGGPKSKIGALWFEKIEKVESKKYGETYMKGHIETPLVPGDRLYIAIFKATPAFEGEELKHDYEILWSPAQKKREENQNSNNIPVVEIDEDEIPF